MKTEEKIAELEKYHNRNLEIEERQLKKLLELAKNSINETLKRWEEGNHWDMDARNMTSEITRIDEQRTRVMRAKEAKASFELTMETLGLKEED